MFATVLFEHFVKHRVYNSTVWPLVTKHSVNTALWITMFDLNCLLQQDECSHFDESSFAVFVLRWPVILILLCQHDGENTCSDSLVAWIWRVHVQVKVVVINLPKARCALKCDWAKVMLPIWVIVWCEGIIPAPLIQKVGHIFQPLHTLSGDHSRSSSLGWCGCYIATSTPVWRLHAQQRSISRARLRLNSTRRKHHLLEDWLLRSWSTNVLARSKWWDCNCACSHHHAGRGVLIRLLFKAPMHTQAGQCSSSTPKHFNTNTAKMPCKKSALLNDPALQMPLKHRDQV